MRCHVSRRDHQWLVSSPAISLILSRHECRPMEGLQSLPPAHFLIKSTVHVFPRDRARVRPRGQMVGSCFTWMSSTKTLSVAKEAINLSATSTVSVASISRISSFLLLVRASLSPLVTLSPLEWRSWEEVKGEKTEVVYFFHFLLLSDLDFIS